MGYYQKIKRGLIVLFFASLLYACDSKNEEHQIQGEAQGTTYTVKYIAPTQIEGLKPAMDSLLSDFDQSLSTYIPESNISMLNSDGVAYLDQHFRKMYLESAYLNEESDGAFDPTLGPLIKAWGFDFSEAKSLDSATVKKLLQLSSFKHFSITKDSIYKSYPDAYLNFNAIAQGYAVDLMAEYLENKGVNRYYVELGGELKVKGKNVKQQFWQIGIDKPQGENLERQLSAIVSLENKAMATSGNYRKFYEKDGQRYSHTISPISGYPVTHNLLSATVVANDCYKADAIATAFMVMGLEKSKLFLEKNPQYEAFLVYSDDKGNLKTFATKELAKSLKEV